MKKTYVSISTLQERNSHSRYNKDGVEEHLKKLRQEIKITLFFKGQPHGSNIKIGAKIALAHSPAITIQNQQPWLLLPMLVLLQ